MNAKQACQTLQIESDASFYDIKYAYRKLALESHPDKNSKESDGKKFKKVTEAYHFLKNNQKLVNSKKLSSSTSEWKYTNTKNKTEQTFKRKKPQWEESGERTPAEDWGRFTKDFEEANPEFWKAYEKEFWKKYEDTIGGKRRKEGGFTKTKKNEPNLDLKVEVDPSLCIGCCSCETIAPEVFEVDKSAKMNPKSHVYNEVGAGYNKIMSAAETCPTKAISVEDKDTKQKLFPW
ncbi:MAG TPA: molecular chaperone DnaJ [Nitrosopumilus sp.]|nr:molecular chaperone DnaJ [Nitrosopumilus sp.]